MKVEEYNNVKIIIGENAEENWEILDTDSEYTWLHLNSFPSCHVIIEDDNVDPDVLKYAAMLCKKNTKYKNLRHLKVCYTKCNNLQKGLQIGSVIFKRKRQVNTITID